MSSSLSVRSRFEVFKRDGFTCRYCGRTPDDEGVKLEVDHITPRADGGSDDLTNLVTSCWDCNHGKAAKSLDDKAPSLTQAMANTRERTLQLDEYRRWQGELDDVSKHLLVRIWDEWVEAFGGEKGPDPDNSRMTRWGVEGIGMPQKASLLRQFDTLEVAEILDAIETTRSKWAAGDLSASDVQRYFFGCLKHKRADKEAGQPVSYTNDDMLNAYTNGRHSGWRQENRRLRDLFLDHQGHGFATYADVVAALWPDD